MVAKITFPKSIKAALNYNETKLQAGQAECLYAGNYLLDANKINFYQKLAGFERLNELNDRATTKTIHVSLNFDPAEKLSDQKLSAIANQYMQKIGFEKQPFLVYKHNDSGHPHIHIVSTTIQQDGSRINTHNIGRNQSETARKGIEKQHGLIKAEHQQELRSPRIKAVGAEKIIYGKSETKRSIANAVSAVFSQYVYSSLPEYNAILKQFNVVADRGKEEGRIFKNGGLVYRVLDASGNKVGVPIKASSIGCQPTLNNLRKKFTQSEVTRQQLLPFVRAKLDQCLATQPGSISLLEQQLQHKNIYTVRRQNEQGRLYGITFVDNQNKVVFNGSDLGKGYSATNLQNRMQGTSENAPLGIRHVTHQIFSPGKSDKTYNQEQDKSVKTDLKNTRVPEVLLSVKEQFDTMPYGLKRKKKKKKKKPDV